MVIPKLYLANDHAAFEAKQLLLGFLKQHCSKQYELIDLGSHNADSVDYPDYAQQTCHKILDDKSKTAKAILLCGSGIGMSIAANRFKGIRAVLACIEEQAKLSRQHNDSNVLCMGARLSSAEDMQNISKAWLNEAFQAGRHLIRTEKLDAL